MGLLADAVRSYMQGPYSSGDKALVALFGGGPTTAGVSVNETTALNLSAFWCGVNCISATVASLPLHFYKRLGAEDKEKFYDHPLYELLHDQPNPETTSIVFRQTLGAHALTWGNGYAEIQRDQANRPIALWQITPERVEPYRETARGPLTYRVTNENGRQSTVPAANMFHLPGPGFDGTRGYSVVAMARESLGLTVALETYGASFFGNGAHSGGVLMHPAKLSDTARKNLIESVESRHQGAAKANRTMIVEEGMKWERSSIPPDDAQFLSSRAFQTLEIARWLNMPAHKLNNLDRATFANIEHLALEFVTDTLMPWLVRWEQELARKLIRPLERRQQFFKHNVNAFLRGDAAARQAFYATGRQWGYFSANDVRRLEDENGIGPEGDIYLVPQNMIPADRVDDVVNAQIAPKPAPTPPAPAPTPAPRDDSQVVEAVVEAITLRLTERAESTPLALPPVPDPRLDDALTALREVDAHVTGVIEALQVRAIEVAATVTQAVRIETDALREALAPPPAPEPDARIDVIADAVRALPQPAALEAAEHRLLESVEAARQATLVEVTERLATDESLRQWQQASVAAIAARLVRREVAFAKKLAADGERADARLGEFYEKFVADGLRDFEPFARFFPPAETKRRLRQWATDGQTACLAALSDGGMTDLLLRWVERHEEMTGALLAIIDRQPTPPAPRSAPSAEERLADLAEQMVTENARTVRALAVRPPTPVNVEPASVTVNTPVTIAEGAVRVDAPVTVDPPDVVIGKGAVQVQNHITTPEVVLPPTSPPVEVEKTVKRDAQGRIISVTEKPTRT